MYRPPGPDARSVLHPALLPVLLPALLPVLLPVLLPALLGGPAEARSNEERSGVTQAAVQALKAPEQGEVR